MAKFLNFGREPEYFAICTKCGMVGQSGIEWEGSFCTFKTADELAKRHYTQNMVGNKSHCVKVYECFLQSTRTIDL